jgi:hypothetical protein
MDGIVFRIYSGAPLKTVPKYETVFNQYYSLTNLG